MLDGLCPVYSCCWLLLGAWPVWVNNEIVVMSVVLSEVVKGWREVNI